MRDLLGRDVTEDQARAILKRRDPEPKGYAALPGTGPDGETCGSCAHVAHFDRWAKCRLVRGRWTGGRGSDVKVRSPACRRWEAPPAPGRDE
jgi:hypothetical protein